MKRLLFATALTLPFIGCTYEEYTPPSPIEMKPRESKPVFQEDDVVTDKFGDENLEPIDMEEKLEDFDPTLKSKVKEEDDIITLQRKQRAGKLKTVEVKNLKIQRKNNAGHTSQPQAPLDKPKIKVERTPAEKIITEKSKTTPPSVSLEDEDFGLDD